MHYQIILTHSNNDKPYADAITTLLHNLGWNGNPIASSHSDTQNSSAQSFSSSPILNYLHESPHEDTHAICLLSDHYYNSPACMNEIGAIWVLQRDISFLAVPGFDAAGERVQGSAIALPEAVAVMDDEEGMRGFLSHIKESLGLNPDDAAAEEGLRDYLDELKRIQSQNVTESEVESVLQNLASILKNAPKPEEESFFLDLGKKLWEQDRNSIGAIEQYLYAIYLNENCEEAYNRIVEILAREDEYRRARKLSEEAMRRFPGSGHVYGVRGYLESQHKNYIKAIDYCNKAIALEKSHWYYNIRGCALWKLNRRYDALRDFWCSVRIRPKYGAAVKNVKLLCNQIGINEILRLALQKKKEKDWMQCRMYLECVLIADWKNETAKAEVAMLKAKEHA